MRANQIKTFFGAFCLALLTAIGVTQTASAQGLAAASAVGPTRVASAAMIETTAKVFGISTASTLPRFKARVDAPLITR